MDYDPFAADMINSDYDAAALLLIYDLRAVTLKPVAIVVVEVVDGELRARRSSGL